jgi:branched-chain amino acid transport system substrate-binding protein
MRQRFFSAVLVLLVVAGCAGDNTIKFGAVLPLTGDAAIYGRSVHRGVELAFEQIQANSDSTYLFELEILDSGSDPAKAAELLAQLYDGGALAVIGGVTTAEALEMVAVADKADRVLLSPSASSPELTGISRNFFRVFFSDFDEGTKMGNFAVVQAGLKSVVILAKEERWAAGVQEIFAREFARHGGEVLESLEFPEGTQDFSGLIGRLNTLQPAAVYLAAYAEEVAALVEQIRASGYSGRILTTHAFASPTILERVGEPARGVLLTGPQFEADSENEPIKSFITAFGERYNDAPDVWSAHGYDSMKVLVAAIPEKFRTPSDFRTSLKSTVDYPGVAGVIQFDEKGDVSKFPHVYQVTTDGLRDYEIEVSRDREALMEQLRALRERRRKAQMDQGKN